MHLRTEILRNKNGCENYSISEPLRPDHFEEFEGMSGDGLDAADGR